MLRIFVGLVGLMALLLAPAAFLTAGEGKATPTVEASQALEPSLSAD